MQISTRETRKREFYSELLRGKVLSQKCITKSRTEKMIFFFGNILNTNVLLLIARYLIQCIQCIGTRISLFLSHTFSLDFPSLVDSLLFSPRDEDCEERNIGFTYAFSLRRVRITNFICRNERRRRQRRFHWIIRSPWHRRRRLAVAEVAAAARWINATLEYKLVERFEIVRFSPIANVFRGGDLPPLYTSLLWRQSSSEKIVSAFSLISLCDRALLTICAARRSASFPVYAIYASDDGRHSAYIMSCITSANITDSIGKWLRTRKSLRRNKCKCLLYYLRRNILY